MISSQIRIQDNSFIFLQGKIAAVMLHYLHLVVAVEIARSASLAHERHKRLFENLFFYKLNLPKPFSFQFEVKQISLI